MKTIHEPAAVPAAPPLDDSDRLADALVGF